MPQYHLFQGFGVELEYMIVERDTLAVKPIAACYRVEIHKT
jgi:hypothetical protein